MTDLTNSSTSATNDECQHCVMNRVVDPDLELIDGVCNHCRRYKELLPSRVLGGQEGQDALAQLADRMRKSRSRGGFDCVMGVSGGVDSTYVALVLRDLGLNPLAIHVDNGWNSQVAVSNIEKTLRALDIDLRTEVLDLREFYDLQRAFLLASTPDGDIPADHAIQATLWKAARKNGVKFIASGMNFRTESVDVPSWSYGHSDWRYVRAVHKRHGKGRLRSYPHFSFSELFYTNLVRGVRSVSVLNYLDYDKSNAIDTLGTRLSWEPYGGKHYESIYTRWYQGYVLPVKFGIDKRRGHLSDLINSGQLTREAALQELRSPDYDERLRQQDQALVLKKLQLTEAELDQVLTQAPRTYRDFPNSHAFVQRLRRGVNVLRARGMYPR